MAYTVEQVKDLVVFGREQGLQSLGLEGLTVVYGAPLKSIFDTPAEEPPVDSDDLRRFSVIGRKAMANKGAT